MNPGPVTAPGMPRGQPGSQFTTFNRGILGGAIDGIRIIVPKDEVDRRSTGDVLAEAIEASKKSSEMKDEAARSTGDVLAEVVEASKKSSEKKDEAAESAPKSKETFLPRSKSPLSSTPSLPETPLEKGTFAVRNPIKPRGRSSREGTKPTLPAVPSSSTPLAGVKPGLTLRSPASGGAWRRSKPSRYTRRKF
jgi:hypothetical protein